MFNKKRTDSQDSARRGYSVVRPGSFSYYYGAKKPPDKPSNTPSGGPGAIDWYRPNKPLFILIALAIVLYGFVAIGGKLDQAVTHYFSHNKKAGPSAPLHSISQASSLWVVVNKERPLDPLNYVPSNLGAPKVPLRLPASNSEMDMRSDAAYALQLMFDDANRQGAHFMLASGYRSYQLQVAVHDAEIKNFGAKQADLESALPGHSEHQTGLAADVEPISRKCEVQLCFASTPEGRWLAANAYTYGFIIRYPQGKQDITGYEYEPWHIRYVGVQLAREMHNKGITTLEEFFHLPAAP